MVNEIFNAEARRRGDGKKRGTVGFNSHLRAFAGCVRIIILCVAGVALAGCVTGQPTDVAWPDRVKFVGFDNFSGFTKTPGDAPGEIVLTSQWIRPSFPWQRIDWDELVVSWNASSNTCLRIGARARFSDHFSKYYNLGAWSLDTVRHPRKSGGAQIDDDGKVKIDTLVLNRHAEEVQVRVTIGSMDTNIAPELKFLGLSFCNSKFPARAREPNRAAWGKSLDVPERRQAEFAENEGWCSPTSLSMVLAYWGAKLNRPELNRTVPEVAAAIYDVNFHGTGNWPFNTAYAGAFPGMRAYVTRLDDISELEDWIAAGVPPILSLSSYITNDRHSGVDNGHLIVCVGFTENGDMIANDPGVSVKKGERAQRVYPRQRVIDAWKRSKNAVYLIYPETVKVPESVLHHWAEK